MRPVADRSGGVVSGVGPEYREALPLVGPGQDVPVACIGKQCREAAGRVLVRVLGVDGLPRAEQSFTAVPAHPQGMPGLQVHLDPGLRLVPAGMVAPLPGGEVGADQAVGMPQQVQVEGGGDAERVVVGLFQLVRRLHEVDADQQPAAAGAPAQSHQEGQRLLGREVADAGTGVEEDGPALQHALGQVEGIGEVHADAGDVQRGVAPLHRLQRLAQELHRDVDRHVGGRPKYRQQPHRLRAVARAQVRERAQRADRARHVGGMALEDRRLGAGGVVLVQLGDGFEQARAEPVVEELGRERCAWREQPLVQLVPHRLRAGVVELQEAGFAGGCWVLRHRRASGGRVEAGAARRMPACRRFESRRGRRSDSLRIVAASGRSCRTRRAAPPPDGMRPWATIRPQRPRPARWRSFLHFVAVP